jgi:double-stranded uracil-DNA glycosylase
MPSHFASEPVLHKRCFDPVVDRHTRVLVLGSLPGDQSLARNEYYGNRQNKFWELLGSVIGVDLRAQAYSDRLASLLVHGIGLWDVIAQAQRAGSLDTAIRDASHNALAEWTETLPNLAAIAFNGGTSARIGRKQLSQKAVRVTLIDLPSSSPAHTIGYERKQEAWQQLRPFLRCR